MTHNVFVYDWLREFSINILNKQQKRGTQGFSKLERTKQLIIHGVVWRFFIMVIIIESNSKTELSPDNFKVKIDKFDCEILGKETVECIIQSLRSACSQV